MKVRTLMAHYGLKRRRAQGLTAIRADLRALGLETVPDFETTDFDDQVRFVLAGAGDDGEVEDAEGSKAGIYRVDAEPGGVRHYRVLVRTYDCFERFREGVIGGRLAQVFQSGQNPRREDRDTFPFHIILQLGEAYSPDQLQEWLEEAARLGEVGEVEDVPEIVPESAGTVVETESIKDHITDLYEGLRSDFAAQVAELRSAMEAKVDEIRFDAIQKLAREINDEGAMRLIEDFDTEMRGKLDAKETDLRARQIEINLLQSQLADLREDLLAADVQDEYDPADAYPTLAATVRLFQDISQGSAVSVHEKALKSAQRSASTRRREVLLFLLTVRELADITYRRGGVKQSLREWFGERGYEYAQCDSQTASTKYGDERQIQVGNARVQMEEHVTLFPNTTNCVSIYFVRDDEAKQVIVGYVGPHLRTAGSR
ncbi:MAG: hypothetical protein ACLQVD_05765 [Capsulimonadaceae bacterium]